MSHGILVDYEWCSGCHSCEMACTVELSHKDFPKDHCGVKVHHEGLYKIGDKKWNDIYLPIFTDLCDACAERTAAGQAPTCVKHCQAKALKFGDIAELAKDLAAKPKQTLYCLDVR